MQAVVRPASTAPWVARKPAPPAPTTTTSNVWSTKLYVRVELMLFLDKDADLSARRRRWRARRRRKEIVQSQRDHFGRFFVNVVFGDDLHSDSHMSRSAKDELQRRDRHQRIAEIAAHRRMINARQCDDGGNKQQRKGRIGCIRQPSDQEIPGAGFR